MRLSLAVIALLITAVSCQKAVAPEQEIQKEISQDVINSVRALGFSADNIIAEEGGYIV